MRTKHTLLLLASALAMFVMSGCDEKKAQIVDISGAVNGKIDSIKNMKSGLQIFGGMGFIIADPAKNGGNWVIETSPANQEVEVDVSPYVKENAKYIFVLHAAENAKIFGILAELPANFPTAAPATAG